MAEVSYLIPEPKTKLGLEYLGTLLMKQNANQYACKKRTDTEEWWAIGMMANNGTWHPCIVSNVEGHSYSYSDAYEEDNNPLSKVTGSFEYNGTTFYVSFGAYGSMTNIGNYMSYSTIPVYTDSTFGNAVDAGKKLIELYKAAGGTLPNEKEEYPTSWIRKLVDGVWKRTFAFAHAKTVYTDYANKKTLADKLSEIDTEIGNKANKTELMDIKMLGWSVPRECPIQNEVTGSKFTQKVGRIDLGSLDYILESSDSGNQYKCESVKIKTLSALYVLGYTNTQITNWSGLADKCISMHPSLPNLFRIRDDSYTDASAFKSAMKGKYLYYELATPITTTIDGNEIGETISDVRKETTVNLLNANQPSSVTSGVTKTNNGDGTYTIQGTASQVVYTNVGRVDNFETGVYKLTGTKVTSGNVFLYINGVKKDDSLDYSILTENTKPISLIDKSVYTYLIIGVAVANGVTVNETIRPMLTTNLQATYDDFVLYTGNTGSINGDVASLLKRIEALEAPTTKTDTLVTE